MSLYLFKVIRVIFVILSSLTLMSMGSATPSNEVTNAPGYLETKIESFNKLNISVPAYVEVTIAEEEKIIIKTEPETLPKIIFENDPREKSLVIRKQPGKEIKDPVHIKLSAKTLEQVVMNGNIKLDLPELFQHSLGVELNGNGKVTCQELLAKSLVIEIKGNGLFDLKKGEIMEQEIDINGNGAYKASSIKNRFSHVAINGSGQAELGETEILEVVINGNAKVTYKGNPHVTKKINGSGKLLNK